MVNDNLNPAAPPVDNSTGQPTGIAPQGATQPPASGTDQTSGGDKTGAQPKTYTDAELRSMKSKADRWDVRVKRERKDRNNNRSTSDYDTDNTSPEILETLKNRDSKIDELSSVNVKLEVKDKVRDLLDSDDYKDIPSGIRRAIVRNPLGFAGSSAHSVDEAVADIQDYLDDELDNMASGNPAPQGGNQPAPAGTPPTNPIPGQTPPAGGSGPSNPQTDVNQGTEGKSGSKRSVQVLQNILKGPKQ